MDVIQLKPGLIKREGSKVVDARSSVSLIKSENTKIIVDTGMLGEEGVILDALKANGLMPGEINIVINTHLHLDHCGCNLMFKDAIFYADQNENPPAYFRPTPDGHEIIPDVKILSTPGHTEGSITVLVKKNGKTYAITGDAIPTKENYEGMAPPMINMDERLAVESMKRIIAVADYVIPGHGTLFEIVR